MDFHLQVWTMPNTLAFLLKTWIYLWKHSGTNFLASISNFAAFSFLSQISQFLASFFTFIILSFLDFFFSSFLFSFLFLFSFFSSFSFCFYQSNLLYLGLYCFPHSSRYLVIFTFSVLQSISGLWWANHSIPKIMFHFCPSIMFISIFSLCP